MRFFIAGIMQGSHRGAVLHDQQYRRHLSNLLAEHFSECHVYDPLADHQNSLDYHEDRGREVFFHHNQMCCDVDVVLAFVPEASMGTAIEMWQAFRHRRVVITISPLEHNWAVRFLSHQVYPDIKSFEQDIISGQLARRIEQVRACPDDEFPVTSS